MTTSLYDSRPPTVDSAVREKFHEACQPWVMDAAVNYTFGAFGSGIGVATALAANVAAAGAYLGSFLLFALLLAFRSS